MDINPLLNDAVDIAVLVIVPAATLLARAGLRVLRDRLHLDISAADEATIESAVQTGVGVLRADLVTGKIQLPDIHLGSQHVDRAAQIALNVAGQVAASSNLTKDDVAARIVAQLGHALGDDPQVPSVAAPDKVTAALAAAGRASVTAVLLLALGGAVTACTSDQVAQAQKAAVDACAADQALVPPADAALVTVPGQVGAAASLDATVVHPLVAAGCTKAMQAAKP